MILPISLLAVVLLFIAPYVSCQTPASNQTLVQALAGMPECQQYRELLLENPEAQNLEPGQMYSIFCPGNEAVLRKIAEPAGNKVKRDTRKAIRDAAAMAATNTYVTKTEVQKRQVTNVFTSPTTMVLSSPTTTGATSATLGSSSGGSLATSTPVPTGFRTSGPDPFAADPNQATLKTTFNDTAFVNLGPGEFLPMVSFSTAPGNTSPKLVCGLGNIVDVATKNIPFNLGVIQSAKEFVTLPETLSQSITILGQRIFLAALTKYNLLSTYDNTPRITAFVPIDSSLSGEPSECTCKQHVVEGPPLYTPNIVLGRPYTTKAGGSITIEIKDGVYTLPGGATIVKANVITKNGVVHFVNGTISGGCEPKPFTGGSSRVGAWMGGLVGLFGVVVGLLA
ncbi:hypothetical protein C7212DRAFT_357789 [Tuber magnatum]|uniref:FAS1 domain-containing protein n=1 Tax=Tuber magnatum TaxID=42249 RepID=A0A317SNI4_9PEZI|nr:hypothetical protein C7212DRAFT_357789 [Tuber magnatum]